MSKTLPVGIQVYGLRDLLENTPKNFKQEAIDNIDEIIEVSDGIMIARGDLGVEVPAEEVPIMQKDIIAKCNAAGKGPWV